MPERAPRPLVQLLLSPSRNAVFVLGQSYRATELQAPRQARILNLTWLSPHSSSLPVVTSFSQWAGRSRIPHNQAANRHRNQVSASGWWPSPNLTSQALKNTEHKTAGIHSPRCASSLFGQHDTKPQHFCPICSPNPKENHPGCCHLPPAMVRHSRQLRPRLQPQTDGYTRRDRVLPLEGKGGRDNGDEA